MMALFQMYDREIHQNGFTLVELLVALVVASFLLIILFNGLANASERSAKQVKMEQALILAQRQLDLSNTEKKGTLNALNWTINEKVIARDPRGSQALVKRQIEVRDEKQLSLISLEKRYVKNIR